MDGKKNKKRNEGKMHFRIKIAYVKKEEENEEREGERREGNKSGTPLPDPALCLLYFSRFCCLSSPSCYHASFQILTRLALRFLSLCFSLPLPTPHHFFSINPQRALKQIAMPVNLYTIF